MKCCCCDTDASAEVTKLISHSVSCAEITDKEVLLLNLHVHDDFVAPRVVRVNFHAVDSRRLKYATPHACSLRVARPDKLGNCFSIGQPV